MPRGRAAQRLARWWGCSVFWTQPRSSTPTIVAATIAATALIAWVALAIVCALG